MKKVPIVDAELAYECKCTMKTYPFITRDEIYITSVENNLISPFIMREYGQLVNAVARIHSGEYVSHKSLSIIVQ